MDSAPVTARLVEQQQIYHNWDAVTVEEYKSSSTAEPSLAFQWPNAGYLDHTVPTVDREDLFATRLRLATQNATVGGFNGTAPTDGYASMDPLATEPRPTARSATADDWNVQRARIEQLYRVKKKTLRQVMEIMKEKHGFKSTTKIYKTYISKWKLDKKNKRSEMMAIVHKNRQRADAGKRSVFRVRGKEIDMQEVERYLERAGLSTDDIIAQRSSSVTSPSIECWTPVCSPRMTNAGEEDMPVPSSMTTPQTLRGPEIVFRCIRDYISGMCDGGIWRANSKGGVFNTKSPRHSEHSALQMSDGFSLALSLLNGGRFQEGRKVLSCIMAGVKTILVSDDCYTILALFSMILKTQISGRLELSTMILRCFSEMATIVLPGTHPLRQALSWLSAHKVDQLEEIMTMCHRSASDGLESTFGPGNLLTIAYQIRFFEQAYKRFDRGGQASFSRFLQRVESFCGPSDLRTGNVRLGLAWYHYHNNDYLAAIEAAHKSGFTEGNQERGRNELALKVGFLQILGTCQYALCQYEPAEENLREAISLSISCFGGQHNLTIILSRRLEQVLVAWGKLEEAARVRDEWEQALHSKEEVF